VVTRLGAVPRRPAAGAALVLSERAALSIAVVRSDRSWQGQRSAGALAPQKVARIGCPCRQIEIVGGLATCSILPILQTMAGALNPGEFPGLSGSAG
jgi:hypothetical protein